MKLGTGQSGATLATCILRDGSSRPQADMWSTAWQNKVFKSTLKIRHRKLRGNGCTALNPDTPEPPGSVMPDWQRGDILIGFDRAPTDLVSTK